jgi:Tfp pilus assembly protein PilV
MKRRGVSLLEAIIAMSGLTVLLSMTGVLLHRGMQAQAHTRHFHDFERDALRLANQFRADVHRARSSSPAEGGADGAALVELTFDNGETATYESDSTSIRRTLSRHGDVISREVYRISRDSNVSVRQQESPSLWVLTVEQEKDRPTPGPNDRPMDIRAAPVGLQVEAVLGRDGRFAEPAAEQGDEA